MLDQFLKFLIKFFKTIDVPAAPTIISTDIHANPLDIHPYAGQSTAGAATVEKTTEATTGVVTHTGCPPTYCRNGGKCVKGPGGYSCNCLQGFHGLFCDGKNFILFFLVFVDYRIFFYISVYLKKKCIS